MGAIFRVARFGKLHFHNGKHHIKADQIAEYQTLVFNGYAQDAEAFAKNIIVEQNASNPNRVDVLWPGTLINQLRIFALLNQFRLQAESTGA